MTETVNIAPKVFFANERTFLAWVHTSVILAGASFAIQAMGKSDITKQLYGIALLPVAISFISYAMWQYTKRNNILLRQGPGPYEDVVGPIVLGSALLLTLISQFIFKLYHL